MTTNSAKLLGRKHGYSIVKVDDTIGFNNYVIVNEESKDYYEISMAKRLSINESIDTDIFYTIKKNGYDVIKEDIYTVLPYIVVKDMINEVEEYVDHSHNDEVIDFLSDTLESLGHTPRHVIHYDDVEETLDYEFLLIIAGSLDTIYVSVENNGDIFVVEDVDERHFVGNMENPESVTKFLGNYLHDLDYVNAMVNEDLINEAINESFNQIYGVVTDNGTNKIYDKKTLEECGFVDRKNNIYKLSEELSQYGRETIKLITEEYEVRTLLSEEVDETVMNSKSFEMFKELFLDKPIKINNENFDGEIVITKPEFKMMTWIGEPHPTVKIDISITNLNTLKNLIPGEDDTVFDFNESPELKNILHSLTNLMGIDSTVLYGVRQSIEGSIKKKLKYFGLGELNPSIRGVKVSF